MRNEVATNCLRAEEDGDMIACPKGAQGAEAQLFVHLFGTSKLMP